MALTLEELLIKRAIDGKKRIKFTYNGYRRVVEPHALGINYLGNTVIRGYQTAGKSLEGTLGWKLFRLDSALKITLTRQKAESPREGFKQGDKAMLRIIAQVEQTKGNQ